jgi:hypothetical protein
MANFSANPLANLANALKSDEPSVSKRNGYSLEDDLGPLIKGDVVLPNFEELDFVIGARAIAGGNYFTYAEGRAKTNEGGGPYPPSAKYFLTWAGMSPSNLDGGGYVLIYDSYAKPLRIGRFAICKHSKKLDAGANPGRGWHPGSCQLCGLGMTVDSGD